MAIHTLADQVVGFGVGPAVYPTAKGNTEGVIFIDFDGTSFTAKLQARAEDGDTWLTMANISEGTEPKVQPIPIPAQMRLEVLTFNGNTLTVEVAD